MRIALTGGIACGKSLLSRYLNEMGVETLDADEVAHRIVAPGGECADAVLERFGSLDRARLAELCFASPGSKLTDAERRANLSDLEAIVHPAVRRIVREWCDSAAHGVLRVAEVPLLFESHQDADFDTILCIATAPETQMKRMTENRAMSREAASSRIDAQMPIAEKAAASDYVITNEGDETDLRIEARKALDFLIERSKR